MASFWPLLQSLSLILTIFTTTASALSADDDHHHIKLSTISAAPAVLPGPPLYDASPALSPDIAPLFPSPAKEPLSPTESSLPTIPSSPSPPNPDAVAVAPGPGEALPPSSSGSLRSAANAMGGGATCMSWAAVAACGVMWIGLGM